MATTSATAPNGKAATIKKTFSRQTSVSIDIKADPAIIWALLINAADYPRWNPTIISISGKIAPGETIRLVSALDTKRTFKLKVKQFDAPHKLVWGDAMGTRVFILDKNSAGAVQFTMSEKIGGPIFPLFAKMIPPFDEAFEQFDVSLKKESENIMHTK